MQKNNKSVVLLINDELSSSRIFSSLLHLDRADVKLIVFDGNVISGRKGMFFGAIDLMKKMSFRYWLYQSFLVICYKLASFFQADFLVSHNSPVIRAVCKAKKIPYIVSHDFNSPELLNVISDLAPDMLLIRCSQIIGKNLIGSVKGEVYCVHSSILPSYKGIAAEFHCMKKKENIVGVTIFKVVEALDKGPVVSCGSVNVNKEKSLFWHVKKNNQMAALVLFDFVNKSKVYTSGFIKPNPSYYSWPTSTDVSVFKLNNFSLIFFSEILSLLKSIFLGESNIDGNK